MLLPTPFLFALIYLLPFFLHLLAKTARYEKERQKIPYD
jgi:hypothetical protein